MKTLKHKFLEEIPDYLEDGILYISMQYKTVVHKCACGCGNEVVTPLTPNDWKLIFDGRTITLRPSIGNWNFDCKSHYWITNNAVEIIVDKPKIESKKRKRTKLRIPKWFKSKKE